MNKDQEQILFNHLDRLEFQLGAFGITFFVLAAIGMYYISTVIK